MADPRFPIGPYQQGPTATRNELLIDLVAAQSRLQDAVAGLSDCRLDTPYREGGWTSRQVVHHLADSHMNWYVRTKLAVTEDEPVVKSFDEALWAELADVRAGPVGPSLLLVEMLHCSLSEEQWKRTLVHPERGVFVLDATLSMHAWHCRHHTAQIVSLRQRSGWR